MWFNAPLLLQGGGAGGVAQIISAEPAIAPRGGEKRGALRAVNDFDVVQAYKAELFG